MAESNFDPPDPYLIDLAARINKAARQGKISFFAKAGDVSVIFQHGAKRAVVALEGRPSDGDVEAMVVALESWSGFAVNGSPYTTEIPPLPESGW